MFPNDVPTPRGPKLVNMMPVDGASDNVDVRVVFDDIGKALFSNRETRNSFMAPLTGSCGCSRLI